MFWISVPISSLLYEQWLQTQSPYHCANEPALARLLFFYDSSCLNHLHSLEAGLVAAIAIMSDMPRLCGRWAMGPSSSYGRSVAASSKQITRTATHWKVSKHCKTWPHMKRVSGWALGQTAELDLRNLNQMSVLGAEHEKHPEEITKASVSGENCWRLAFNKNKHVFSWKNHKKHMQPSLEEFRII